MTLDLNSSKSKELFRRLVKSADVAMENFRPGVMSRLGLGHKDLFEVNAKLVHCAIWGFGEAGPLRDQSAYADARTSYRAPSCGC